MHREGGREDHVKTEAESEPKLLYKLKNPEVLRSHKTKKNSSLKLSEGSYPR